MSIEMSSIERRFKEYAESWGVSTEYMANSFLAAMWEDEIRRLMAGGVKGSELWPSRTGIKLRDAGIISKYSLRFEVDRGVFEEYLSSPWLPSHTPGDYVPFVDDSELNRYTPSEGVKSVEPKTLADMLPEEEESLPEPEAVIHGGHDLREWMGEDAKLWKTIQETQNDNKRRYRRL